jgi:protocatechuate 3,4-dioxygenase beta subunit
MSYRATNDRAAGRPPLLPPRLALTPAQVLGPYYLPNSPQQSKLFPDGATGHEIHIEGQVMHPDLDPAAGAVLEVWLADPDGRYDNQDDSGDAHNIPQDKMVYRGSIVCDAEGYYSFQCLRPGNYFNDGPGDAALWRPAHIHVKIGDWIGQVYFEDDPQDYHDLKGPGFFQPSLVVMLTPASPVPGKVQRGIFNFVVAK